MKSPKPAGISIAVVRVLARSGPRPVIRIFEMRDLFGSDHVLSTTTSPDEAAEMLRLWLHEVTRSANDQPTEDARGQ